MAARSFSETQRVRYLLGLSTPAEREVIESLYFEDDDAFQKMLTAEDDLIDAYARGELTGEERRRFENSFVSSLRGRDRVQFARAFAGTIPAAQSQESKLPSTLLDIFKRFQSPLLLRTATVVVLFFVVMVLAWLVNDRRRMTNELRELRAEFAELSKRTEVSQRNTDNEGTRTIILPEDLQAQPNKPRRRERRPPASHEAPHLPKVVNKEGEKFVMFTAKAAEILPVREDATLGNATVNKKITDLPLETPNSPNLLTLQIAATRDGVEPLNTYSLTPSSSGQTTIRIPSSRSWIRFRIGLETAAIHEDYRVSIKATDGRPVTSVAWSEPLTPSQTMIDSPVIPTENLPSGDYVLSLMGKESGGSFVIVAVYSFKVTKY